MTINDLTKFVDLKNLALTLYPDLPARDAGKKCMLVRSPWRVESDPSFAIYSDGYKDFATGDHGSVLDFVIIAQGGSLTSSTDILRAVQALREYTGGGALPAVVRQAAARPSDAADRAVWQRCAGAALDRAVACLWGDDPAAVKALAYLRTVRGLTDQTIRAARLGFIPERLKTAYIKPDGWAAHLWAGIVIPWFDASGLTALHVRTITGNLAEALGVADQVWGFGAHKGDPLDKYLSLYGSTTGGAVYGLDRAVPGRPVMLVEGEFSALAAGQALPGYNALTLAGAGARLTADQAKQIADLAGGAVTVCPDNDARGLEAGDRWVGVLAAHCMPTILRLTVGIKDVDQFLAAGGSLPALLASPALQSAAGSLAVLGWAGGLPRAVETAINTYQRDLGIESAIAVRAICLAIRDGLNSQAFTLVDVASSASAVAAGVKYSVLAEALADGSGLNLFIRKIEPITESYQTINQDRSLSDSSILYSPNKSFKGRGRPPVVYRLRPLAEVIPDVLHKVIAPRLIEQAFKGRVESAPFSVDLLEALAAEDAALADAVRDSLTLLGWDTDQALRAKVVKDYTRWQRDLSNPAPSILPDGAAWSTVDLYKQAIVIRDTIESRGLPVPIAQRVKRIGLSGPALKRAECKAGILRKPEFKSVALAPGQMPIAGFDFKAGGYVRGVFLERGAEVVEYPASRLDFPATRAAILETFAIGGAVKVKVQIGSSLHLVGPEAVAAARASRSPVVDPVTGETYERRRRSPFPDRTGDRRAAPVARAAPARPYLGVGYSPSFARAWLLGAMAQCGFKRDDTPILDPASGELIGDGGIVDPASGLTVRDNRAILRLLARTKARPIYLE